MNKSKLLFSIPLFVLASQAFAVTEQLDFYANGNRHSTSGQLKDFKNITKYKNYLIINDAQQDSYVTLNKKNPYFITYNEQPLDFNSVLERHKNEKITINGKEYKLIDVQNNGVVVQKDQDSEEYTLIKNVEDISFKKNWLREQEKGLKVYFQNDLNNEDLLSYSQIENGLNYKNKYQVELVDDKNLDLTHYIQIDNGTNKVFENINVSFFLSDINVNKSPIMFKGNMMAMQSRAIESDMVEKPEFQNTDLDNIKVISLKSPITIFPNMNKINFEEKKFNYEEISKINIDIKNYLPSIRLDLALKFEQDSKNIEEYKNQLKSSIKNNLDEQKYKFQDYIVIKNKDKIFPAGNLDVYQGADRKLIVSDNIGYSENKDLEILKKSNSDLEIIDFNLDIDKINKPITLMNSQQLQNQYYVYFKDFTINNKSNRNYNFMYNGHKYEIKSKEKVVITVELTKAS